VLDLESTLIVVVLNALMAWSLWFPVAGGQLAMALPGTLCVGAYAAGYIALHSSESLALGLAVGAGLGAVVGIPLGLLACRLEGFAFAIATIGVAEAIRVTANSFDFLGGPMGLIGILPSDAILPVGLAACAVLVAFAWLVFRSRLGRMIDVVAHDELEAAALGVPIHAVKLFLLIVSGAVAGFTGALLARYTGLVTSGQFDLALTIQVFAFVALGGIGTTWGPMLGAAFLTVALQVLAFTGGARSIVYGAVLIVVMLARRDGLLKRSAGLRGRSVLRLLGDRWALTPPRLLAAARTAPLMRRLRRKSVGGT
jgi:ABC-type branched-subunit amino acid transport system permease subunit